MKRTDEEIDKLFQDAAGKVEAPYQDSYWTEMEVLLPKDSKKKGFWWIFGTLFALVGIACTMFVVSSNDTILENSSPVKLGSIESKEVDQKQSIQRNNVELKDAEVQKTLKDKAGISAENLTSKTNTSQDNRESKIRLSDDVTVLKLENKNSKRENNNYNAMKHENSNVVGKQNTDNKKVLKNNHHQNLKQGQALDNVESTTESNSSEENSDKEGVTVFKDKVILVLEETKEKTAIEEKSAISEIVKDSVGDDNNNNDLVSTEVIADKTVVIADLKNQIQQPITTSSYYVQFGGRFGQSYLSSLKGKMMSGVTLGAGYQYIRPGIGYAVGLNFTSSFVQNMEIVRKSRVYGFGVTNYEQSLKYKQLTYLEVPISINYVHLKNTFTVGVAPTYLVSTMMNFSERQELEVINERNYYGQKIGLKTLGMETMIGYQRAIKNNWSVGVNIGVTLFQQIEDNHFENQVVAFPINGQLIVRKSLIFKK